MEKGLSPEDILKNRENEGGIDYDSDASIKPEVVNEKPRVNPLQERLDLGNINDKKEISASPNLGTIDNKLSKEEPKLDMGWKNLPLNMLPSKGNFYPEGAKIAIRPAEVAEIRHFSTIDEDDKIGANDLLNSILDRCMRIQFDNSGLVSYKDIIQEDRFYIILAIRDITFIKGENKIMLKPTKKCKSEEECPFTAGIELNTWCLDFFNISPDVMKYYSPKIRGFEFRLKDNPDNAIFMYMPTIGVKEAIDGFKREMVKKRVDIDSAFMQIVPFMFPDWRNITSEMIYSKFRQSDYWSKEEFSLYFMLSKELKLGTKLEASVTCPNCNEEVKAPIVFKNGIKSIFVISDIIGQLLVN